LLVGEQLVVADHAPPTVKHVNVGLATAWQTGLIVFEDATLAEAVARLNRYSQRELVIDDDVVRNIKISGAFKAGDMNGFVATVTTYFPVSADQQSGGDIKITRRSQ
jgi:transmembrane sensor